METNNETATLLLNVRGEICSVYGSQAKAEAQCAKFNADPFLSPGEPDPDAPYSTKTWGLCDRTVR